jgi:hypothetical protein
MQYMHKRHADRWPAAIVYWAKHLVSKSKTGHPKYIFIHPTVLYSRLVPQIFTHDREGINKRIRSNQNLENKKSI